MLRHVNQLFRRSRRDCGNLEADYKGLEVGNSMFGRSRRDCGNLEAEPAQSEILY